ncbi:MAG: hypothetical protein PQJ58_15130 [Spirochaetales bacterium]|nr:hypothetical protein [Spirochaetales bacterium]
MNQQSGEQDIMTPEVQRHISQLIERMKDTPYGDVGLVFTMSGGKVSLIKPINLPVIKALKHEKP